MRKMLNSKPWKNIGPTEPMTLACKDAKQSFSYLDLYSSAVKIHRENRFLIRE